MGSPECYWHWLGHKNIFTPVSFSVRTSERPCIISCLVHDTSLAFSVGNALWISNFYAFIPARINKSPQVLSQHCWIINLRSWPQRNQFARNMTFLSSQLGIWSQLQSKLQILQISEREPNLVIKIPAHSRVIISVVRWRPILTGDVHPMSGVCSFNLSALSNAH